jgi:uncharacterized protein
VLIAIVSDTHMPRGNRRIPERCIELMRGADLVLHAGDFCAVEVLEEIEALGPPVIGVSGNMDTVAVRLRLPEQVEVEVRDVVVAMVHDAGQARGRLERQRARFPRADAVVFGHSHLPLHERDGDFQIFNPGSPTERRKAPRHTMGLARVENGAVSFELVVLD